METTKPCGWKHMRDVSPNVERDLKEGLLGILNEMTPAVRFCSVGNAVRELSFVPKGSDHVGLLSHQIRELNKKQVAIAKVVGTVADEHYLEVEKLDRDELGYTLKPDYARLQK